MSSELKEKLDDYITFVDDTANVGGDFERSYDDCHLTYQQVLEILSLFKKVEQLREDYNNVRLESLDFEQKSVELQQQNQRLREAFGILISEKGHLPARFRGITTSEFSKMKKAFKQITEEGSPYNLRNLKP